MEGRLLLSLPTILAADILQKWLNVRDTVQLDSAYCSVRHDFLDLIGSSDFAISSWVFDPAKYVMTTNNVLSWANVRDVTVEKLSVDKDSDLKVLESFLKKRSNGVQTIKANKVAFTVKLIKSITTCTNLTTLDLCDCEVPAALRDIFIHCKNLRDFRCNFMQLPRREGSKKPKKNALKDTNLEGLSCPNIKAMRIQMCEDRHLVASLLKLAPAAKTVLLSSIRTDYIDALFDYMSPTLTTLCLPEADLSPEGLYELIECFPDIQHLDLDGNELTDLMLEEIGDNLPLKSLSLSSAPIGDEVLESLAKCCGDKLTELLLCQCYSLTLEAVQDVLPRFTKLTSFSMHYNGETDMEVMDLSLLGRFPTLTLIYEGEDGADFVNDVARHCPKLQHLHIQLFDEYFLAEDMDHLVNSCVNLRSLTLAGEIEPYHGADDVARWRVLRPGLAVSSNFVVEMSVMRDAV